MENIDDEIIMDRAQYTVIGQDFLAKARNCIRNFQIFDSLRNYLLSLEYLPEHRDSLHAELAAILILVNDNLNKDDPKHIEDMQICYKFAMEYFPTSAEVLTSFGTFLLMLQASEASIPYFLKALEYNPDYLLADKNLDTAKLNLLPRWHFRMMNDKVRNNAYRNAIHAAISPQHNNILDIGCGCGLLSYFALEHSDTKTVLAVESSEQLYKIAKHTLGNFDKVQILNTHSTELSGIGAPNVLITEIFDAGFFGEWVLGTVIHAWDNLLEPSAKIIPSGGEIFVTGISSQVLLNKHKLCQNMPGLNLGNVCVTQNSSEPYEAEYFKHFDIEYITETQTAVRVNLSDVEFLKNIYTSYDAIEPFTLKCTSNGTLHAFAIWFDLHLDSKITITTNPHKESVTCWEQAIVYLNHPLELQIGQEITIQFSCVSNKVEIKILDYVPNCEHCFKVSQNIIQFINDEQNIKVALEMELPERFNEDCDILELNPFPLFMLYRSKRGFTGRYWFHSEIEDDLTFIEYVWKRNTESEINFNAAASYDVIFINPISENGTIHENVFQNFGKYQHWLKQDGIILPKAVKLQLELVDSPYLDFCCKVSDENLCGFNISNYLNNYAVYEHWQVEPRHFPRKILAQSDIRCDLVNFCLKDLTCKFHLDVVEDGTINGILYWFRLEYGDNLSINTYDSTYYFSACFVCKCKQVLKISDKVPINVFYVPGFLKINLYDKVNNSKLFKKDSNCAQD